MQYTISNSTLSVTVDTCGAELVSVKKDGKERLWQNESGDWAGHAPILFPVAGCCHVWKDGKEYPIKKHGFARLSAFSLMEKSDTALRFRLKDSAETRAVYPYAFVLDAVYRVEGDTLFCELMIENPAEEALPFAAGGHECHRLPKPLDAYRLVFPEAEHLENIACGDFLGDVKLSYGTRNTLDIPVADLQDKDSVIFRALRSRSVMLTERDGTPVLSFGFRDFGNLLLWSPDGRHALCVEPWQNLPDTRENTALPLAEKYGVVTLLPHTSVVLTRSIRYFG